MGNKSSLSSPDASLLEAATQGQTDKVRRLIESGADVNCTGDQYLKTPLMEAAWYVHRNITWISLNPFRVIQIRQYMRRSPLSVCVCVFSIVSHVSQWISPHYYVCTSPAVHCLCHMFAMFTLHINEGSTYTEHVQTWEIHSLT